MFKSLVEDFKAGKTLLTAVKLGLGTSTTVSEFSDSTRHLASADTVNNDCESPHLELELTLQKQQRDSQGV